MPRKSPTGQQKTELPTSTSGPGRPLLYGEQAAPASTRVAALRQRLSTEGLVRLETTVPLATRDAVASIAAAEGVSTSEAAQALLQYAVEKYRGEPAAAAHVTSQWPGATAAALASELSDVRSLLARGGSLDKPMGFAAMPEPVSSSPTANTSPIAAFFRRRRTPANPGGTDHGQQETKEDR